MTLWLVGVSAAVAAQPSRAASNVTIASVNTQVVGALQIRSSSRLAVTWTPAAGPPVDHYEIVATEAIQTTPARRLVGAGTTSVILTDLKAATTYSVVVVSCEDPGCTRFAVSSPATGATDREFWQLQGTGNTVRGLDKIVSDGNARLSVTRFGADAVGVAGAVQLYYGPFGAGPSPLAVAIASQHADAARPASFLSFASRAGSSGLMSPPAPSRLVKTVNTGQGVPLSKDMGGRVRLFFEALGDDGRTRILQLDSQDGYFGQDFNTGTPRVCSTTADYGGGGGCEPAVAIGVDGDADHGNPGITNARQFKLGWPILDTTHWTGAPGTFMVFTTDRVSGCTEAAINHGYAVWDGARWNVQYLANGCPKLFTSTQAAFPFHLGGARYKLYYGDPSVTLGKLSSPLPFVGPKKLIYADGTISGQGAVVDFEDWEPQAAAREVAFLWPTGELLDDTAEGYLDDFHVMAPTGTLDLQVFYMTITDGAIPPFAAAAILRNP